MFWVQSDTAVADSFECDVTNLMVISSILQWHWQRYRWTAACRSENKKCRNMRSWTTAGRWPDRAAALMPPCKSPQHPVCPSNSPNHKLTAPHLWFGAHCSLVTRRHQASLCVHANEQWVERVVEHVEKLRAFCRKIKHKVAFLYILASKSFLCYCEGANINVLVCPQNPRCGKIMSRNWSCEVQKAQMHLWKPKEQTKKE